MKYSEPQIEDVLKEVRMKYTKKQIDEYRAMWLAQLRDPESECWIGELENIDDPNKRCCLGHACHALQAQREEDWESKEIIYRFGGDYDVSYLPRGIAEKLNISIHGKFRKSVIFRTVKAPDISCLNDSGLISSPAKIADIIEEQFKNDNFIEYNEQV